MATAKAAKGNMMEYDDELVCIYIYPFWIFWDPVFCARLCGEGVQKLRTMYRGPDALQRWYPSGVGGCREFQGWPLHLPVEGAESAWNSLVNIMAGIDGCE